MRRFVWLAVAAWVGTALAGTDVSPSATSADTARAAAESLRQAIVAKEMSLLAVQNAVAEQNAVETEILHALQTGNQARVRALMRTLQDAFEAAEQARRVSESILACVETASRAASSAKEESGRAASSDSAQDSARAAQKAERDVKTARKAAAEASARVAPLKERWLILAPSSRMTTNILDIAGGVANPSGR